MLIKASSPKVMTVKVNSPMCKTKSYQLVKLSPIASADRDAEAHVARQVTVMRQIKALNNDESRFFCFTGKMLIDAVPQIITAAFAPLEKQRMLVKDVLGIIMGYFNVPMIGQKCALPACRTVIEVPDCYSVDQVRMPTVCTDHVQCKMCGGYCAICCFDDLTLTRHDALVFKKCEEKLHCATGCDCASKRWNLAVRRDKPLVKPSGNKYAYRCGYDSEEDSYDYSYEPFENNDYDEPVINLSEIKKQRHASTFVDALQTKLLVAST